MTPQAQLELALSLHQRGELGAAMDLYRNVIRLVPDNSNALHYLGVAQLQQGKLDRAFELISRAIELNPDNAQYHNDLGEVHRQQNNLQAAVDCYRRALLLSPHYAQASHNLGLCFAALGQLDRAIEGFNAALNNEPNSFESHLALGNVFWSRREFVNAANAFETALTINPDMVSAQESYGQVLDELGQGERARAAFSRALDLEPRRASVHCRLGGSLLVDGEIEAALESFKRCIECDPAYGNAWERLADAAKFVPLPRQLLEDLEHRIDDSGLSDNQRISLWFAFGTLLDTQAFYDQAFGYFQRANDLSRRRFQYDKSIHEARVNRTMQVFDDKRIAAGLEGANSSETPIFIVGMARSGTSLLEQIIASHPEVYGAGELEFFSYLKFNNPSGESTDYRNLMDAVTPELVASITTGYLSRLREQDTRGAKRIVDKMPDNYLHLGLIALLFPKATILHSCRDAMDVCVSNYFTNFSFGNRHACDLHELGHYYYHYARLMKHWHQVLPGRIFDVHYESIVNNQIAETRRILALIRLPWSDACLHYFEHKRPVRTASQWQVRQPLYASSIGRAKQYRQYLGALSSTLGSHLQ